MDLINLKDISDLNVNFNVKVIDIDFYNVSNRRVFLGHVGDYNLYVLHLIIPKDSNWIDPMQIILSYQNNTLSKAKWIANPSKIVGNSYYFLVNGDIVSTAGEGFLQFQVVLPSKDATTKTVIAKSKKIPYVVEESLTLESSAEEVTPEQISSIDRLITDYTNMLESYDLNDIFELERRVEVLEGLHGSENIYNPFGEYDIIELQLSNNVYNVIEPTLDLTTIRPSRVIETSASMYTVRQFLRLNDFKTRAGDKLTLTGKVTVNKAKENFKADRIMLNLITNQSSNIPQAKVVKKELTESLYDSTYIGTLGKEGWFSYTTTLEEDGNYLIFGACAQSRQLVGDGSSSNPYAPIKISNLKLIRENEDEEAYEKQSSFFSRYSKNDLEKAYKEVFPISIYKQDKVLDYLKRAREKKEYYLIDSNSYADGISIIDDASFINSSDTTNYSIPNPYLLHIPSNSSTVEFFNTQTKENWIYEIEQGQTIFFEVKNLIPEHLYVYTFKDSNGDITGSDFLKIKGPVRFIDVGVNGTEEEIVNNIELKPESTIFNVRDLGGWKCDRGKLKYGVIYRGSTLSELYEGTVISLSDPQKQFLVDKLKIRDEIDLRGTSEISGRTSSVLNGASGQQVGYKNFNIGYSNPLTGSRPEKIANIIKRLSNNIRNNKTTYIHCSAGADRTALICSIIEAICGVSQIDLDCDYEISSLAMDRKNPSRKSSGATTYGERLRRDIDPYGTDTEGGWDRGYLFQKLRDKGNGNLRDGTINFLLENGVTREEIDIIRAGLIEYEEPEQFSIDNEINVDQVTHNQFSVPTNYAVIHYVDRFTNYNGYWEESRSDLWDSEGRSNKIYGECWTIENMSLVIFYAKAECPGGRADAYFSLPKAQDGNYTVYSYNRNSSNNQPVIITTGVRGSSNSPVIRIAPLNGGTLIEGTAEFILIYYLNNI